jgi:hypothetical protein
MSVRTHVWRCSACSHDAVGLTNSSFESLVSGRSHELILELAESSGCNMIAPSVIGHVGKYSRLALECMQP